MGMGSKKDRFGERIKCIQSLNIRVGGNEAGVQEERGTGRTKSQNPRKAGATEWF